MSYRYPSVLFVTKVKVSEENGYLNFYIPRSGLEEGSLTSVERLGPSTENHGNCDLVYFIEG